MSEREQAERLAKAAPPLSDKELAEINAKYTAYIFRDRKKREIWATCCGRHEIIPKKEYTDGQHTVMIADHQGESHGRGNYYSSAENAANHQRHSTPCPFCGEEAYVKELGRTGMRDNLASYRRFVAIKWHRGALWARVYYTAKKYGSDRGLTARPSWQLYKVYRFKPGEAICANSYGWGCDFYSVDRMAEPPKKLPLKFYEPFPYNSSEGMGYTLVGVDEIKKSPLKYCGHEDFFDHSGHYMRFLAVCCFYPRQVEMLMKTGMKGAVKDFVEGRKKNAAAFNWSEENPLASFQLSKAEMSEYLAGEKNLTALAYYKQFRRKKISCTISEVEETMRHAPYTKDKSLIKCLKGYTIEPGRWNAYILRETQTENGRKKSKFTAVRDISQLWIDYIDAAVTLGYDLTNPLMLMPRGIRKKHDAAAKSAAAIIAARLKAELGEKEKARLEQVTARYGFAGEQYVIVAPIDSEDIVNEGKALKHCVGGYAERHMNGKLTIMFLRSASAPCTPLVTIEMNGDKMVQLHGYNNDKNAKIKPREKYADILDPWLKWVKAGSKRDKEGNPVPPRKRQVRQRVQVSA
ncbi:MAG: PcfJ domain-containing protein [Oscillospiraceae bacterium]|nr:PcfJ domain-containing protein [Oscillospiraceae bacterium]